MTLDTVDDSQRRAGRVAGFTFLLAMAIVVLANYGINFRLIVPGNAVDTARNIMAHETLFRLNIACNLIYIVTVVVLPTALYVTLKPVNRNLALLRHSLQTLARLHLTSSYDAYYVGFPFWGLASTICSYLWFKSRYIPRTLAAFGVVSSGWCVICAFAFIVLPHFDAVVNAYWFDSPMVVFEMALGLWLLFKGLIPSGLVGSDKAGDRAQAGAA